MAKRQHSPRGSFTSEPTSDHSKTCSINFPLPALDTLVVGFRNGDIFRPDGILHHAKVWFDFISLQQNTYFLLRVLLLFGPYSACFPGNPVTTAKRNTEGAGENKVICESSAGTSLCPHVFPVCLPPAWSYTIRRGVLSATVCMRYYTFDNRTSRRQPLCATMLKSSRLAQKKRRGFHLNSALR